MTTTLPQGMFPTLADTFGERASDVHELIDIQRARIAEQDALIATLKAHLSEIAPLATRAAQLQIELTDESRYCDYFRDEAIENAAHLARVDDLLSAVGIEHGTTIDRVNTLISLWLSAEARAQGLNIISNVSGADGRCDAPASAGDVTKTHRDAARG